MRPFPLFNHIVRSAPVLVVLLLSIPAQADPVPDALITTRVKLALFAADTATATAVHVDTNVGQVLLYGKVASAARKKKAGGIARGITGATGVTNMLQVVSATDLPVVNASDDRISSELQKQLGADASLTGSHVAVKSVNKGVVLLSGDAVNLSDQLWAVETASRFPGVRSVVSEIHSSTEIAPYELTPAESDVKRAARNSWLVVASKLRFLADPEVPATEVGVEASNDVVTLFGIVPSEKSRTAAGEDVRKVDSKVIVKNELQVVPSSSKRRVDAKDDLVRTAVQKALAARTEFHNVSVAVSNGAVRLSGTVQYGWQRLTAGLITRATKGVRAVEIDLKA